MTSRIGQCATGTSLTHAFHIGVHSWSIETQTKAVERLVRIEVATIGLVWNAMKMIFLSSDATNCSHVNEDVPMMGS